MRASRAVRPGRRARHVLAAGCGLAWWWAALRLAFAPSSHHGLAEGASVAGWSLGLIPLHAVPAHPRIRQKARRLLTGSRGRREAAEAAAAAAAATAGPAVAPDAAPHAASEITPAAEITSASEITPVAGPVPAAEGGEPSAGRAEDRDQP